MQRSAEERENAVGSACHSNGPETIGAGVMLLEFAAVPVRNVPLPCR